MNECQDEVFQVQAPKTLDIREAKESPKIALPKRDISQKDEEFQLCNGQTDRRTQIVTKSLCSYFSKNV